MLNLNNMSLTEQDVFASICQDLLSGTFIMKEKNKKTYYFILKYKDIFISYFNVMKYDLNIDEDLKCINLSSVLGKNKIRFNKNETIILLFLRKLYEENMRKKVSYNSDIEISSDELIENISTMYTKIKINKTFLRDNMKRLKSLNIVNYDIKMNSVVLYNSLLMAVETKDIVTINDMLIDLTGETK